MLFYIIILNITLIYGFTPKIPTKTILPPYEIPKWVYEEVFEHNKIKNKNIQKEKCTVKNNKEFTTYDFLSCTSSYKKN